MTATRTMADKGDDYVAAWPGVMARRAGLSVEYVAPAMHAIGLIDEATASAMRSPLLRGEALPEIGALTPDNAKRIIGELQAINARIDARRLTHCDGCGLPLVDGECEECV
jgi:hypothetical protein